MVAKNKIVIFWCDKSIFVSLLGLVLFLFSSHEKNKASELSSSDKKGSCELVLSHEPGVYEDTITLSIKIPGKGTISIITPDDNLIIEGQTVIYEPTVVKIDYLDSFGKHRQFIGNYIVNQNHQLPIVALTVNESEFFPPEGIYDGYMYTDSAGELRTVGKSWKKKPIQAHAQFFFNNMLKEELELELKTYGGMTLGWKEKSLQLSARKEIFGKGKIKIKAFEQLSNRKFQHLVLRTSGNDQNKTRLKDKSISMVADEIKVNTKASRSVILYINARYWGIHNLREKVNKDYFRYHYNWKKDSFIEIQGAGFHNPNYKSLIRYVRKHHADSNFHQRVSDSIDVENFFNFNIIQTFISNTDYRGNVRFYKPLGGKWKWILYDVDLACNLSFLDRNFIKDRINPTTEYWYNPPFATDLLKYMLKNDTFKISFIKQYNYLMATKLLPSNFLSKIDNNISKIEPELERHWKRREWLYKESRQSWEKNIKNLKSYFVKRPESALRHLGDLFNLNSPQQLIVNQNITHFNGLTMNGSKVLTNEINGMFFTEFPIELEALNKNHLYQFVKWSDDVMTKKRQIQLTSSPLKLQAEFEHLDSSSRENLKIRRYYVKNKIREGLVFVTLLNDSHEIDSLKGVVLYEDNTGSQIDLSQYVIEPGEEIVLTNNQELLQKYIRDSTIKTIKFMEGIIFAPNVKFTLVDKEGWIDSLHLSITDSMLIDHAGFLVEKDSVEIRINNFKLKNMKWMEFGKTIIKQYDNSIAHSQITFFTVGLLSLIGFLFVYFRKIKSAKASTLLFLFFLSGIGFSQPSADSSQNLDTIVIKDSILEKKPKKVLSDKFGLTSIEKRVIDNKGRGDLRFYGTRNFRVVLYDLVYRGGGNNLHLKDTIPKYYLWNPMPSFGLRQLSEIGFDKAVYLYSHNFEYWYPQSRIDSLSKEGFEYICRPKLNNYLDEYFLDVMERANDTAQRAMYIHCWNGWHQSGLLSAYTLMQFCDYSGQEALKYWQTCTDGNYKGFSKLKSQIRNYIPSKNYFFTLEQKKRFCPCEKDVSGPLAIKSKDDEINLSVDEMMEKEAKQSTKKQYTYHSISAGESLSVIAEKYGMNVKKLKHLNKLTNDLIFAGEKLKVNGNKNSKNIQAEPRKYLVKSGDSLYSIAKKYNTSVEKIQELNGLNNELIYTRQLLKLPAK